MIKKIENFEHEYLDDVKRIQQVLLTNGYEASLDDCVALWDSVSDSYAAGWLMLPKDDDVLFQHMRYELNK